MMELNFRFHMERGKLDLPKIKAIVDVVPKTGTTDDISCTRTFFDGQSVSTLAILARVPVTVAGQVVNKLSDINVSSI